MKAWKLAALGTVLLSILVQPVQAQEIEWMRPAVGWPLHLAVGATGELFATFSAPSPHQGADNVYTNSGNVAGFLWKYDSSGKPEWTAQIDAQLEGTVLNANDLLVSADADGSVLLAGTYSDTLYWNHPGVTVSNWQVTAAGTQPGWSPYDVALLRVGTDGNLLQARSYGGHDHQYVSALAASPTGDTIMAGAFRGWAEFGSILLIEPGGGHWVLSVSSNGYPRWAKPLVFKNQVEGPVMATDAFGNIIVAGAFIGSLSVEESRLVGARDLYLAKFSPDGDLLWLKHGAGEQGERVKSVTIDPVGNIYLSASTLISHSGPPGEVTFAPGTKITASDFVVKFDSSGNALWAIPEELSVLTVGPNGNLFGTGVIRGSRTVGDFSFVSSGSRDVLAAEISPDGNPIWARSVPDSNSPGSLDVGPDGGIFLLIGGQLARYGEQGPRVLQQPQHTTVSNGEAAEFTVVVQAGLDVAFQWFRNGVALTDSPVVSGTATARLRVDSATRAEEGDYTVRIQDGTGTVFSSAARLRVLAPIQFTSIQQVETTRLRLTFEGAPTMRYRFEATHDLTNWTFVTNTGPNNFSKPGEIIVIDQIQPGEYQRYYRAVSE